MELFLESELWTIFSNPNFQHLEKFSSDGKVVKRVVATELTLYDMNTATMSQFLVRPALFDLYLGAVVFSYLGTILNLRVSPLPKL